MTIKTGWLIVLTFAAGWCSVVHGIAQATGRPDVVWPIGSGLLGLIGASLWAYAEIVDIIYKSQKEDDVVRGMAETEAAARKAFSVPRSAR